MSPKKPFTIPTRNPATAPKRKATFPSRQQGKTAQAAANLKATRILDKVIISDPPRPRGGPAPMADVMVDLETLGRRPGCAVLSIGAVAFCTERGLGRTFYIVVNRPSQREHGLHEDPDTLGWWSKQSEMARSVLAEAESARSVPLVNALDSFTDYLSEFGHKRVKIWGNGSDFDNAIMSCLYGAVGQVAPWDFWNNRCYRTLKNIKKLRGALPKREGVYHNALDDAKTQALHAIQLLQ